MGRPGPGGRGRSGTAPARQPTAPPREPLWVCSGGSVSRCTQGTVPRGWNPPPAQAGDDGGHTRMGQRGSRGVVCGHPCGVWAWLRGWERAHVAMGAHAGGLSPHPGYRCGHTALSVHAVVFLCAGPETHLPELDCHKPVPSPAGTPEEAPGLWFCLLHGVPREGTAGGLAAWVLPTSSCIPEGGGAPWLGGGGREP